MQKVDTKEDQMKFTEWMYVNTYFQLYSNIYHQIGLLILLDSALHTYFILSLFM